MCACGREAGQAFESYWEGQEVQGDFKPSGHYSCNIHQLGLGKQVWGNWEGMWDTGTQQDGREW